jgi:hypothetical protein
MEILAMPLSDTFRKAVISIYLQTFVVLLEFLSILFVTAAILDPSDLLEIIFKEGQQE